MSTNIIVHDLFPGLVPALIARLSEILTIGHAEIVTGYRVTLPQNIPGRCHFQDWRLQYAQYDCCESTLLPIDEGLLTSMAPYETMALKCFDKLEKLSVQHAKLEGSPTDARWSRATRSFQVSYSERKRIYLRHLRFWNDVIQRKCIKLFIATNTPHVALDFVIYGLCKTHNIPVITFETIGYLGRLLLKRDLWEPPRCVTHRLEHLRSTRTDASDVIRLEQPAEHFWRRYTAAAGDPHLPFMSTPGYGFLFYRYGGPLRICQRIGRDVLRAIRGKLNWNAILPKAFVERSYGRVRRSLSDYYDELATKPDYSTPYIYLPLHLQPELSTAPLAGAFAEQFNVVHMLSRCAPAGVTIYVKEHPAQPGFARTLLFYRDVASLPNVRLVPRSEDSFQLIAHSAAVATCTGTAGWEALFKGKPVLVFGSVCYEVAPGAFRIHSSDDCRRALLAIFEDGVRPTLHDLRLFLSALQENTLAGYLLPQEPHHSTVYGFDFTDVDTIKNVVAAIARECQSMFSGGTGRTRDAA